jgi:hypothetical protein
MIRIKVAVGQLDTLPHLAWRRHHRMADGSDIRAQVAADNLLQDEINRGLAVLAAPLPADADLRMIRILARVLESSWAEHVGFQHHVLYPIVAGEFSGVLGIQMAIARLREEHKDLAEQHAALTRQLHALLRGDRSNAAAFQALAGRILHQRSGHFAADGCIADRMPTLLAASDVARHRDWLANRLALRFPIGLFARRPWWTRKTGSLQ